MGIIEHVQTGITRHKNEDNFLKDTFMIAHKHEGQTYYSKDYLCQAINTLDANISNALDVTALSHTCILSQKRTMSSQNSTARRL